VAQYDFFLAHAGEDKSEAERLRALLDGEGARVFLDSKEIAPGDYWDQDLAAAQRNSRITVVLVSARTDRASYQREEIATGLDLEDGKEEEHQVIPVYLGPEAYKMPPYGLRVKQGLIVSDEHPIEQVAARLLELHPDLSAMAELAATRRRARGRVLISYIPADEAWATWLHALIRAAAARERRPPRGRVACPDGESQAG
jgi:hypothetical protein